MSLQLKESYAYIYIYSIYTCLLNRDEKNLVVLGGFVGDEMLPSSVGILLKYYKDPY